MSVSLIIPTLNEVRTLPKLLVDLEKQTHPVDQIILVDGGSTDGTIDLVKKHNKIELRISSQAQTAVQRNLGISRAQADWILLLDADVRLAPDFIEKSLTQLEQRSLDIACPWYLPQGSHPFSWLIYLLFSSLFWLTQRLQASGAGMCIWLNRNRINRGDIKFDPTIIHDDIALIRKLSQSYRYGILNLAIRVSDRRLRKQGHLSMLMTYLRLSYYFMQNKFVASNQIKYDMSESRYDTR